MDDAKELTGWKKVSQFVYRAGLLFLHSFYNPALPAIISLWLDGRGLGKRVQWSVMLKTTIKHICLPKGALVYMHS